MNVIAHKSRECVACHGALSEHATFCPQCGKQQPGTTEQTDYEYAAFISYRHKALDTKIANAVQEAIETYRLPKGFESPGSLGSSRALGKCFRDEDELAAASSLPDTIRSALVKSRTLIVVCTPETPQSAWIKREFIAFCELHGRERVFAVLADGSSAESIPRYLRERIAVDINGNPQIISSGPLAADYRAGKSESRQAESMRIIAAVAGCGYDELRQRERVRKRQQRTRRIAIVACLTVVIAALGAFGFKSFRNAQVEESLKLAAESRQHFSMGDRYGAIELALKALPSSSTGVNRPLVDEAQEALEDALEVNPSEKVWRASYLAEETSDVTSMVVSAESNWFATMNKSCEVHVRDASMGSMLATCKLPQGSAELDGDSDNWIIEAAGDYLIAAEHDGSGIVACFNTKTGESIWDIERAGTDALAVSRDGKTAHLMSCSSSSIYVAALDVGSGEVYGVVEYTNPGIETSSQFLHAEMGENASILYVAANKTVMRFDLASSSLVTTQLPEGVYATSLAGLIYQKADGGKSYEIVVASSTELNPDKRYAATAVYYAFDAEMNLLWSNEAAWSADVAGEAYSARAIDSQPDIRAYANVGSPALLCSAGACMLAFSATGEKLVDTDFESPIVGIGAGYFNDSSDILFVVQGDGSLDCRIPGDSVVTGGLGVNLPAPVSQAYAGWVGNSQYIVVAQLLNDPKRIVSYHMDLKSASFGAVRQEHSLDDLIAQAHELLDSIAQ